MKEHLVGPLMLRVRGDLLEIASPLSFSTPNPAAWFVCVKASRQV